MRQHVTLGQIVPISQSEHALLQGCATIYLIKLLFSFFLQIESSFARDRKWPKLPRKRSLKINYMARKKPEIKSTHRVVKRFMNIVFTQSMPVEIIETVKNEFSGIVAQHSQELL